MFRPATSSPRGFPITSTQGCLCNTRRTTSSTEPALTHRTTTRCSCFSGSLEDDRSLRFVSRVRRPVTGTSATVIRSDVFRAGACRDRRNIPPCPVRGDPASSPGPGMLPTRSYRSPCAMPAAFMRSNVASNSRFRHRKRQMLAAGRAPLGNLDDEPRRNAQIRKRPAIAVVMEPEHTLVECDAPRTVVYRKAMMWSSSSDMTGSSTDAANLALLSPERSMRKEIFAAPVAGIMRHDVRS